MFKAMNNEHTTKMNSLSVKGSRSDLAVPNGCDLISTDKFPKTKYLNPIMMKEI